MDTVGLNFVAAGVNSRVAGMFGLLICMFISIKYVPLSKPSGYYMYEHHLL
jgi:hypothetical protein